METMQQYKHESYALGFEVNDEDLKSSGTLKQWRHEIELEQRRKVADLFSRLFDQKAER